MAMPAGPILNNPNFRQAIRDENGFETEMEVYLEIDENDPYKGLYFIKWKEQGDDRFIPLFPGFPAAAPYPTALVNGVKVGSRLIKEVLGEVEGQDIVETHLENAGIAVPPAPLEVFTELGSPNGQRAFTGCMFVKYGPTEYRALKDYDFVISSLEKADAFLGDLNDVFDSNHVDARFITDYQNRNF